MMFVEIETPLVTTKKYTIMLKQMPVKRNLFFQKFVAGEIEKES